MIDVERVREALLRAWAEAGDRRIPPERGVQVEHHPRDLVSREYVYATLPSGATISIGEPTGAGPDEQGPDYYEVAAWDGWGRPYLLCGGGALAERQSVQDIHRIAVDILSGRYPVEEGER